MKAREFLNKGNNHLTRLEFQQALDAYTECLLCDPNNRIAKENIVLTHNNWGIYWYQRNKFKEAREEWDQALKLNPNDRNARNNMNILNFRMKQLGLSEDGVKKAAPPPKETGDFPPSQVIILTPGVKNSSSSGASASSGGSGSAAAAQVSGESPDDLSNSGSGAVVILKNSKTSSATTSGGDTTSSGSASSSGSSSPAVNPFSSEGTGKFRTAPSNTPSAAAPSTYNPPATYNSPSNPSTPPAATAGGSQEENIADSLGQIEQKIYGRKQDSLPIMKRLEKLEIDTNGKTKTGTIKERIDTLKKSYGF